MINFLNHEAARAKCFHPTGKFIEFRKEDVEKSIPGLFESRIEGYLNRTAIKTIDREMSYDELDRKSNVIARILMDHLGESGDSIALLFGKGAEIVVSIFGVLKAGKIYVPLDTTYPYARLSYMLSDSQARLIITDGTHLPLAQELSQGSIKIINFDDIDFSASDENLSINISPETPANILYTSGSSGQPKGVLQSHRTLLYETRSHTNQFHTCDEDRIAYVHSESFSASVRRIFPVLLNGAVLCPLDVKRADSPNMIEWMRDEGITIGSGRHLLAYIDGFTEYNKLPDVRLITIGSDVIRKKDIEDCRKFLSPDCIIAVNFATTETGTDRQYFISMDTEITTGVLPVGYEVEGKKILILDDDHQEVGVECVGEIAIKSQYLSPGYWQRPDLTDAKFLPDPDGGNERIYLTGDLGRILSDGCLVHMGRKDFQVNIRGHRIEIGEVENALLSLESIKEAVVVSREDSLDDQRLVAYVAPSGGESPAVSEIRHALLDVLPGYMVPSVFVMLDALPLNVNNKVDRKALPEPDTSRPELEVEYIAPGDGMEKILTDIWKEALGLDKIGVRDSFFDLGGNSLIAVRLSAKVQEEFGKSMPISALLQAPTIEQLADMLRQEEEFPERRID